MVEKVVYFLGAGFSAPLGLPVMNNFFLRSKDIYFENPDRYAHFKDVFDTVKEMSVAKNFFASDLYNIEEILSILEMRTMLTGDDSTELFQRYIKDVISHFTPDVVPGVKTFSKGSYNSFFGSTSLPNEYGDFVASLLNLEVRPHTDPTKEETVAWQRSEDLYVVNDVISLNYDLVLEKLCQYLSDNYVVIQPGVQFDRLEKDQSPEPRLPRLMKLHGSVDSDEIVPPTWSKAVSGQMVSQWSAAHLALAEANHIRVLGYSLPVADANIRYLLKSALVDSSHLKTFDVITLDHDGQTEARYDEFVSFKYYRFVSEDVARYLATLRLDNRVAPDSKGDRIFFGNRERTHHEFMGRAY